MDDLFADWNYSHRYNNCDGELPGVEGGAGESGEGFEE
jgi:hypothetical protein